MRILAGTCAKGGAVVRADARFRIDGTPEHQPWHGAVRPGCGRPGPWRGAAAGCTAYTDHVAGRPVIGSSPRRRARAGRRGAVPVAAAVRRAGRHLRRGQRRGLPRTPLYESFGFVRVSPRRCGRSRQRSGSGARDAACVGRVLPPGRGELPRTRLEESADYRLDRVAGGFGVVAAPGRCGPPEGPVGKLLDVPLGVLLEAMVMTALRTGVTQARPAARLVRGVVLEVALGGGPAADGAGAGRVPDLGQVPELDPGIVAFGFEPVVAGVGGDRVDGDDQVRPGSRGAEPPGSGPRAAAPAGGVKENPVSPAGSRSGAFLWSRVRAGRSRGRRRALGCR